MASSFTVDGSSCQYLDHCDAQLELLLTTTAEVTDIVKDLRDTAPGHENISGEY